MSFTGISEELVVFLSGLRGNNTKDWFEAHRADYEEHYLGTARVLVDAAGERLQAIAPNIRAEPKVLGSIFRINRDTRFSSDKRPYKDHLDLWFWEGDRKAAASGFFLRVTPDLVGVGAGSHGFAKDRLDAFRTAATGTDGAALAAAAAAIESSGHEIGGEHYKRDPKGFDTNGPAGRLLRHNALFVHHDLPLDRRSSTVAVLDDFMAVWSTAAPLHRWIVDHVQR